MIEPDYGLFFTECADGHYNALCSGTCGHCLNEQICDKYDGSCTSGCTYNFDFPLCQGNMFAFKEEIETKSCTLIASNLNCVRIYLTVY